MKWKDLSSMDMILSKCKKKLYVMREDITQEEEPL